MRELMFLSAGETDNSLQSQFPFLKVTTNDKFPEITKTVMHCLNENRHGVHAFNLTVHNSL